MKIKNYEKITCILILTIIIIILEIAFFIALANNKMYKYRKLSTICVDKNIIVTFLNKEERNVLYKNNYLYLDNKKEKYKIIKDKGKTLDNKYYEIYLKFNINKKYKINDNIAITLKDNKIRLLEIFKVIWGGDKNS